jgi:hypothetical protein
MLICHLQITIGKHYGELEPLLNKVAIMENDPNYQMGIILLRQGPEWRKHAKEIWASKERYGDTLLYRFLHVMGEKYFNEDRDLTWSEEDILLGELNKIGLENRFEAPRSSDLVVIKRLGFKEPIDSHKNNLIVNGIKARGLGGISRIVIVTVVMVSSYPPPLILATSSSSLSSSSKTKALLSTPLAVSAAVGPKSSFTSTPTKLRSNHDFYDVKHKQTRDKLCDLLDLIHGLYPQLDINIKSSDNSDADMYYGVYASKSNLVFDGGSGFGKVVAKLAVANWRNQTLKNDDDSNNNNNNNNNNKAKAVIESQRSHHHVHHIPGGNGGNVDSGKPMGGKELGDFSEGGWSSFSSSFSSKLASTSIKKRSPLSDNTISKSSSSLPPPPSSSSSSSSSSSTSKDIYQVDDDGLYSDISKVNTKKSEVRCKWNNWKQRSECT